MKVYTLREGQLYQRGRFDRYTVREKAEFLRAYGITTVVNMTARADGVIPALCRYIQVPIPDSPAADFIKVERAVVKVVALMRRGAVVLVHCNGGRNRASLMSARLLMELEGLSGAAAVKELQRLRPNALANPAFVKYLKDCLPYRRYR
jgi:protein-tyrosine phosphatase